MEIRKAQRKKAKLRLALVGVTGSGKTYSALKLAFGMGGKVGLIDTENGSGDLYANLGDYDVITLTPPYTVVKYREAITAFENAGYDVIIVDSLSHAWAGEGGLLDKQGQLESSGKAVNSFAAWRQITPEHNKLVEELISSKSHIISTMRCKTEYVIEPNAKGKMAPRKVGLSPVQRDGVEYEFTVVMDINENHIATSTKDRTSLFNGWADTISEETGKTLMAWLEDGVEAPKSDKDISIEYAKAIDDAKTEEELDEYVSSQKEWMSKIFDKYPKWHAALTEKLNLKRDGFLVSGEFERFKEERINILKKDMKHE